MNMETRGSILIIGYLSVDPVIRTDLLNFRQVTGPVIKTMPKHVLIFCAGL